jgi:hypothetical protein
MLLGKLATPATKVIQNGIFDTTTVTADYMVVSIQRFIIGFDEIALELRFGNVITESGEERFDIVLRQNLKMTSEELSTWGTDDSVLLDLVAAKLGATITEKVQTSFHHTY